MLKILKEAGEMVEFIDQHLPQDRVFGHDFEHAVMKLGRALEATRNDAWYRHQTGATKPRVPKYIRDLVIKYGIS